MAIVDRLNRFYEKLQNKHDLLKENAYKKTLLYYVKQIDLTIHLLENFDETTTCKLHEILVDTKNKFLLMSHSDTVISEGSEEDYLENLRGTLRVWSKRLLDANKSRAAYRQQFHEHLNEQENSTRVKLEWLLNSFEIECNQKIQSIELTFLKYSQEDAKNFVLESVYNLNYLKEEMLKIEKNIKKNFERFLSNYRNHLDALDLKDYIRLERLIDDNSIIDDQNSISDLIGETFQKKGFLINFSKKRKLESFKVSLVGILEKRSGFIKSDIHRTLDLLFSVDEQFSKSLQESFKGEYCSVDDLDKLVRIVNDLDQNLIKSPTTYTIKELIQYG